MTTSSDRYTQQRYLLMTLDPLHPGAGGYRLGRVDNSIIREPGTRLPKIPGSSLHGAARSYAAYLYETPAAAGQKQDKVTNPEQNPVCYTFGYIKGKNPDGGEQTAFSGVVNVFDARILLFPVHSARSPVWASTAERLKEAGFTVSDAPEKDEQVALTWQQNGRLNLGWLMLDVAAQPATIDLPEGANWGSQEQWQTVGGRIALVSENLFSHIVNSNLEVRTSVAINPETGAAEEGALYTYESLPRATFLIAEAMLDEYLSENRTRPFPVEKTGKGSPLPGGTWRNPLDVLRAGLRMMEYLGVGGMSTRGFGRIKIIGEPLVKKQEDIFKSLEQLS